METQVLSTEGLIKHDDKAGYNYLILDSKDDNYPLGQCIYAYKNAYNETVWGLFNVSIWKCGGQKVLNLSGPTGMQFFLTNDWNPVFVDMPKEAVKAGLNCEVGILTDSANRQAMAGWDAYQDSYHSV